MRRSPLMLIITLIAFCSMLTCCDSRQSSSARPSLAVSIPAQKWLLDSIAGDRFNVVTLLSDGSNPETFEPSMKQLVVLGECKTLFTVGELPFEEGMIPKIRENFPGMEILPSDIYIKRLEGTHNHSEEKECDGHHGHHHDSDPHIWTSLRTASAMARAMYEAIIRIDPAGKEYYTQRYNDLRQNLAALDDSVAQALAAYHGRAFIVWHPSLSYFAHDYGLKQLSIENEGKEASPAQYRRQLDLAKSDKPLVFFLQREFDSRQGAGMADELKLRTAEISVMQPDIAAQIRQITHDITSHN